MGRGEQHL